MQPTTMFLPTRSNPAIGDCISNARRAGSLPLKNKKYLKPSSSYVPRLLMPLILFVRRLFVRRVFVFPFLNNLRDKRFGAADDRKEATVL